MPFLSWVIAASGRSGFSGCRSSLSTRHRSGSRSARFGRKSDRPVRGPFGRVHGGRGGSLPSREPWHLPWLRRRPEIGPGCSFISPSHLPSRFGYLGSSMPENPTGAAQADVLVDPFNHLGIESADVMGISAGTSDSSSIQSGGWSEIPIVFLRGIPRHEQTRFEGSGSSWRGSRTASRITNSAHGTSPTKG